MNREQPVTDEVLGARRDGAGIACAGNAKGFALEAAHHRRAESTGQHRCLAKGLGDPAPSRLFGEVQHRRERPGDPVKAGLGRSEPRCRLGRCCPVAWSRQDTWISRWLRPESFMPARTNAMSIATPAGR